MKQIFTAAMDAARSVALVALFVILATGGFVALCDALIGQEEARSELISEMMSRN